MKKIYKNFVYFSVISFIIFFTYVLIESEDYTKKQINENTELNSSKEVNELDVLNLCDRLVELKIFPYDPNEVTGDPVYDGLMKYGKAAVPCLIDKISDETVMKNPGINPAGVQNIKVGDVAVFMLLYITKESWQPNLMFPPELAKRWDSDGIYIYFRYVENSENRLRMQIWWKNRLKMI